MSDEPCRIMHIDDNASVLKVTGLVLTREKGFLHMGCNSGKEALSRLNELQPDLILLDLKMPELDGPATLLKLRENRNYVITPVIFMTGVSDVVMDDCYKHLDVIGVIHKPFDPDILARTIQKALEKSEDDSNIPPTDINDIDMKPYIMEPA